MENSTGNSTTLNNGTLPFLWVAGSKQRDTIGILSFCFSTMIICVWSTVHFNIPATRFHSPTRHFLLRIFWTLTALIAPELLLFFAINERVNAGTLVEKAMEHLPSRQSQGKRARAFNDTLGQTGSKDRESYHLKGSRPRKYRFGLVHAFYATMGGFVFDTSSSDGTVTSEESPSAPFTTNQNTRYVPTLTTFIYVMEHYPHIIPDISEESITDRSESSSLSKALLIVQIGWFVTNCASRLIQRLPLSLLEVTAAAHSLCTLLTYFVWRSKPLNIAEGTPMKGKEAQEVYALLTCSTREYSEALKMARRVEAGGSLTPATSEREQRLCLVANALRHLLPNPKAPEIYRPFRNPGSFLVPGSTEIESRRGRSYEWMAVAVSPILYGVVHVLAWNGLFPTPLERLLWRISSVLVTCSGLAVVSPRLIFDYAFNNNSPVVFAITMRFIFASTLILASLAHMLGSGFLVMESFRQLFFLDSAAYQLPSWSNYWPHLS